MTAGWQHRLDLFTKKSMGRPVSHLSPRYVKDRALEALHRRRFPEHPWLGIQAIRLLESLLRSTDRGLEFGAGFSTTWFAERTASIITVEHCPEWAGRVEKSVEDRGIENVELHLVSERGKDEPSLSEYLAPAKRLPKSSLDFVFVDSLYRCECVQVALDLLTGGGLLILDNAERYLPSSSTSPDTRRKPPSPNWSQIGESLSQWRQIWTSNGVTDTAMWLKPCRDQELL